MIDVAELVNLHALSDHRTGIRGACGTGGNACARRCRKPALPRRPSFCPHAVSSVASPMRSRWHRNSTKALARERRISRNRTRSGRSDHPRATRQRYSVGVVAYDQFPATSPVRRLYEWRPVIDFVSSVLERAPLYQYADPMGALNLAVMGDGDELQWHYDQTDFVVSLALRDADVGGDFEVAPKLRSASRRELCRCFTRAGGRQRGGDASADDAGYAADLRGAPFAASRQPDRRRDRTARCVARIRHASRHAQHAASAAQALRKSARLALELREHVRLFECAGDPLLHRRQRKHRIDIRLGDGRQRHLIEGEAQHYRRIHGVGNAEGAE